MLNKQYVVMSRGRLRRVQKRLFDTFENTLFAEIGGFLAADTKRGPRHSGQATWAYVVAAMHAGTEGTVVNSNQSLRNGAADRRVTIQTRNRELPRIFVLSFLKHIRTSFDSDAVQAPPDARKLGLFRL
jgi:hypothetical protein